MSSKGNSAGISAKFIVEQCVAVRLRMLSRAISKLYSKMLRPQGLTVSQMNILVAFSCYEGAKQQDICRALHLDKSTLSRDVDRMRARKWLEAMPGEDGRSSLLRLTAEGRRLLKKAIPAWHQAQQQATALLGKDVAALHRATKTLRSSKHMESG